MSARTIGELLDAATLKLGSANVPDALDEALFLLGALLDRSRGGLLLHRDEEVAAAASVRFDEWVARRATRVPAQHVTGEQEFYGLSFAVGPEVLIPRPETEMLVEFARGGAPNDGTVIDLGTGSGCIAIAVAAGRRDLKVLALDRSPEALRVARANARRHGVERRIEFVEGDFAIPPEAWHGKADIVLSNPPYVSEEEWRGLEPEVRDHDPKEALVPGPDGLEAYRALLPAAARLLRPDGWLLLELGAGQAEAVRGLAEAAGPWSCSFKDDLNGIRRMLAAKLEPWS